MTDHTAVCEWCKKEFTSKVFRRTCSRSCEGKMARAIEDGSIKPDTEEEKITKRFDFYTDKSGECWIWIGGIREDGYGQFSINRESIAAHRFSYLHFVGTIGRGMHVCHHCDNPKCVRPDHLFLGTHQDNMNDSNQKGRRKGSKNANSVITEDQVIEICDLYSSGRFTQPQLAEMFGITQMNIWQIVSGRTWKHVIRKIVRCGKGRHHRIGESL